MAGKDVMIHGFAMVGEYLMVVIMLVVVV